MASKFIIEGSLYAQGGHYYGIGLIVEAEDFTSAFMQARIFDLTSRLMGMEQFSIENVRNDSTPSRQSVLIYMNNPKVLTYTDATDGGFTKFLEESLPLYFSNLRLAAKDKK